MVSWTYSSQPLGSFGGLHMLHWAAGFVRMAWDQFRPATKWGPAAKT